MRLESKDFIELLFIFAKRLSEVTHKDLGEMLADHTPFRNLLDVSISRENQSDPTWQAFIAQASLPSNTTHDIYQFYKQNSALSKPSEGLKFGCFSFVYPFFDSPVIRLHFGNPTQESVLNQTSLAVRQLELQEMFAHIRHNYPEAKHVIGGSWLYNLDAYCSLFPSRFIQSLEPIGYETGFYSLWGQFLNPDRTVRQPLTSQFIECIQKQTSFEHCLQCFPYQVLRPEAPIKVFYDYYKI